MHHAVVAVGELHFVGIEPTAAEVATKLGWFLYKVPGVLDGVPDAPPIGPRLHYSLPMSITIWSIRLYGN